MKEENNRTIFKEEAKRRGWSRNPSENVADAFYNQNHIPIREQKEAVGHSVRAMYLYTATTMTAAETGDTELYQAVLNLWENTVNKKMYITAGLGSTVYGEAFTKEYDLPNDLVYAETCASVGLAFWARSILEIDVKNEYADILERALYNGILSGMQRDGAKFLYVNPLEVIPGLSGEQKEYAHVLPERVSWYPCACCPPNLARLIMSLSRYAWGENVDKKIIYSHIYLGGTLKSRIDDGLVIQSYSKYPWNGDIEYKVKMQETCGEKDFTLAVRIPEWCKKYKILINDTFVDIQPVQGYCYINRRWKDEERLTLLLDMSNRQIYANEKVRQDIGTVAFMRGPICYCMEGIDNGEELFRYFVTSDTVLEPQKKEDKILGKYIQLVFDAEKLCTEDSVLYTEKKPYL